MPCKRPAHPHHNIAWPTEGFLEIQRCEIYCGFCKQRFVHAYNTYRHVMTCHAKDYPNLIIWKKKNAKKGESTRGASARNANETHSRNNSVSTTSSGESSLAASEPTVALVDFDLEPFPAPPPAPAAPMGGTDGLDAFSVIQNFIHDPAAFAPAAFSTAPEWVTPQSVRVDGTLILAEVPAPAHHGAAQGFAEGLNELVGGAVGSQQLRGEEVLYILQTFMDAFQLGGRMPVEGPLDFDFGV